MCASGGCRMWERNLLRQTNEHRKKENVEDERDAGINKKEEQTHREEGNSEDISDSDSVIKEKRGCEINRGHRASY